MQLIDALAAGIRGAENGTAFLYARGTSTHLGHFADFEGQAPVAAGANIDLDSSGSAVVYVSSMARVVVRSAGGVIVRDFVAGTSAASEEVISSAFTGADYNSAALAVSRPRTAQYLYNLWKVTNGSTDWKVRVNGVDSTIPEAIANASDCFNVKNEAYAGGAAGDGTTNDYAAILAAVTAASDAGGGTVCFPPGTYLMNQTLTVPEGVSLCGTAGPLATELLLGLSSGSQGILFDGDAAGASPQTMEGFRINLTATALLTASLVDWLNASVVFRDCYFNTLLRSAASRLVGNVDTGGTTAYRVKFLDCRFLIPSASDAVHNGIDTLPITVAIKDLHVERCAFVFPALVNGNSAVYARGAIVQGNVFDCSAITTVGSSIPNIVHAFYGGVVTGNDFIEPTQTGLQGRCILPPNATSDDLLVESGNRFGSGESPTTWTPYSPVTTTNTNATLQTRESRYLAISGDNESAITIDFFNQSRVTLERTGAGNQTISMFRGPVGSRGLLTITNSHSASLLFYWGSNIGNVRGWEQILPGETVHFEFEFYLDGSTVKARQLRHCCCAIGELRIEETGLTAASRNHDYALGTIWTAMPDDCFIEVDIEAFCKAQYTGDHLSTRAIAVIQVVSGALTSILVDEHATIGEAAQFVASISSGSLRLAMTGDTGQINAASTKVCVKRVATGTTEGAP